MNAVYIHNPRTAGRYTMARLGLEQFIYPRRVKQFRQRGAVTFGHQDYARLVKKGRIDKKFDQSAFKFVFCRNPFDRLLSHFLHVKKKHAPIFDGGSRKKRLGPQGRVVKDLSFEEFVLNFDKYNIPREGYHPPKRFFRPQHKCVTGVGLDFVGRFERLEEDIEKVSKTLGLKLKPAKKIGVTRHKPYWEYYTDEMIAAVQEFYAEDFKFFGYDKNTL